MKQRVITGVLLGALAACILVIQGYFTIFCVLAFVGMSLYEEDKVLTRAGHAVTVWPTWTVLSAGLILLTWKGQAGGRWIVPMVLIGVIVSEACVLFRDTPKLDDALYSITPLVTVVMPGLGIAYAAQAPDRVLGGVLLAMIMLVPSFGDMAALFVGTKVGGPKFCPKVSPHKTIAGAVGGLLGSVLTASLIGLLGSALAGPETVLPVWWFYPLMGTLMGMAGQIGDLFASLIKRHCGVKDFSNLFPGHGGMMDRMDSILFSSMVMTAYLMMMM